jgi:hypothetical protein
MSRFLKRFLKMTQNVRKNGDKIGGCFDTKYNDSCTNDNYNIGFQDNLLFAEHWSKSPKNRDHNLDP